MKKHQKFLEELADLMEKHRVDLCSTKGAVIFIFDEHGDKSILETGRCHSSSFELRLIAKRKGIEDS